MRAGVCGCGGVTGHAGVMGGRDNSNPTKNKTALLSDTGSDSARFLCGRQEKTKKWGGRRQRKANPFHTFLQSFPGD